MKFRHIITTFILALFFFIMFLLWNFCQVLFWIIIIPLIIGGLIIVFIVMNMPKEYHYEEIESETWLNGKE